MFTPRILIGLIAASAVVILSFIGAVYFAAPKSFDASTATWEGSTHLPDGSLSSTPVAPFTTLQPILNSEWSSSTATAFAFNTETSFMSPDTTDDIQTYFDNLTEAPKTTPGLTYGTQVDYMHLYSFNLGPTTNAPALVPTVTQLALRNYGNTAGAFIVQAERFASENNMTLAAFFENPNDTTEAKVKVIADRFVALSVSLSTISTIPESIQSKALLLSNAYKSVGDTLALLAGARGDEALLAAINTYTDEVSNLGKEFADMVDIFSKAKVTFEADEPGSVFMFTFGE